MFYDTPFLTRLILCTIHYKNACFFLESLESLESYIYEFKRKNNGCDQRKNN